MTTKTVLLTGASGSMGGAAFDELLRRGESYQVVLLLRGTRAERKKFRPYQERGVRIVWGDLCNPDDVLRAVEGVDCVLHPAALIAPAADHAPRRANETNFHGTRNIVAAIKQQPHGGDNVRLVSVCSVAAYGDRLPPHHMVRVGDPLRPCVGDFYATTKVAAEREVIESGLKYWASLRQTWIAIPKVLSLMDPIMFHQPLQTHIEMITAADAGYGLVQSLECPDEFFGRVYNMSGGPSCRLVYSDLLERTWRALSLGDYRKSMARNWFTLRNFHCCWYADSDVLNDYLGHWRHSQEDYHQQVLEAFPGYLRLGCKIAPSPAVRLFMRALADPIKWLRQGKQEHIKAFFGSREAWEAIGGWDDYLGVRGSEAAELDVLRDADAATLAAARGGRCLSPPADDDRVKRSWRCGFGHQWEATVTSVRVGHWCPQCAPPPWNWDAIAKVDPLIAKFHYANHGEDESQRVEYLYCPNA